MFSLFISFDLMMKTLSIYLILFLFFSFMWKNNNNFFFKKELKLLKKEIQNNSFLNFNINNKKLTSLFYTVLFFNMVGMTPFSFTATSQIVFAIMFALIFWMSIFLMNSIKKNKLFMSHLVPLGSPIFLSQFMVIIESLSFMIRPLTLSIRLMANLTAGHLIMTLCSNSYFLLSYFSLPLILIFLLEMMVAVIQAYVFMTLISMYVSEI